MLQVPGRVRSFWHHVGVNDQVDGSRVDPARADLLHLGYPRVLPAMLADGGAPLLALMRRAEGRPGHPGGGRRRRGDRGLAPFGDGNRYRINHTNLR